MNGERDTENSVDIHFHHNGVFKYNYNNNTRQKYINIYKNIKIQPTHSLLFTKNLSGFKTIVMYLPRQVFLSANTVSPK